MNKSAGMIKGEHERAMEKAKEMLRKGNGMGAIVEETKLNEHDVTKARKKMEDKA
ncbi:hypothetical protein [Clostridium oryzae]|uniref:Uncharacterized protein n=1 Tax=Clostridium oryzae TaxID=1450648 RepID=A0A1V4IDP3_9CLOT|nr:hypothetical protein [Clostridium oryzae]OPJ57647.1 hypothetical protein CLORY_40140 [Clostridium oryzae]